MWKIGGGFEIGTEKGIYIIGRLICLGFLLGLSVMDIRFRRLPRCMIIMGGVLAAGFSALSGEVPPALCAAGAGTGILFVGISRLTKESLGYGDSLTICILGMYLGIWNLLAMLVSAFTMLCAAAAVVLAVSRWSRRAVLPVLPFLTAGYILMFAAERAV